MPSLGPLPAVPQALRVAIRGTVGLRPWANVIHFSYSGAAPGVDGCNAIATAVASQWAGDLSPMQDADTTLTQVEVTDLTSSTSGQFTVDVSTPGTRAGSYLPASACVMVSYAVARRYRGGHPRTYLSVGVQGDLTDAQQWSSDFLPVITTAWEDFITALITTYSSTVVTGLIAIQYKHLDKSLVPPSEVYNTPPIILGLNVTDASYEPTLGTQRRRIRKR